MRGLVVAALSLALSACANAQGASPAPASAVKSAQECGVNLGRYMNMDPAAFNDTLGSGWREIAHKEGCLSAAADLLALYWVERIETWEQSLRWHEAQLRAAAGQTDSAIALFEQVAAYRKTRAASGDPGARADWLYAEGTIALLKRDRASLEAARAELLTLPVPADFEMSIRHYREANPLLTPPTWPIHLKELDGFLANFDKPYADAYGAAVREPTN